MKELSPLQGLYALLKDLEAQSFSKDFVVPEEVRLQIMEEIEENPAFTGQINLIDLAKVKRDLLKVLRSHETLDAKVLAILLAPLERVLNKSPKDDEILSQDRADSAISIQKFPLVWVLHNIRSAFNVGSFFRTADGLGVKHIYLCGYTPTPSQAQVAKSSLGAETCVSWSEHTSLDVLLKDLKSEYEIVAFETTRSAIPLHHPFPKKPTAFLFGNERFGIDGNLLEQVDQIRQIPMHGVKNSLNVSVASAISSYEWIRQWTQ